MNKLKLDPKVHFKKAQPPLKKHWLEIKQSLNL